MNNYTVCSPYFDPDFDTLSERVYGPACRVTIDNESLEDCTVVKIDSINKQRLLLEVVQVLTDMNLTISKANISTDASWFMDVFHVKDENGKKISDQRVINYIQKALSAGTEEEFPKSNGRIGSEHCSTDAAAIEMTGKDRPGLFSEISAALADLHINIVEAHAWSHNARLACVAYISDQHTDTKIDNNRLALIEDHLKTVLRSTSTTTAGNTRGEEVKTAEGLPEAEGECCSTTAPTEVERRLHQLMVSGRDFDRPPPVTPRTTSLPVMPLDSDDQDEEKLANVRIDSCERKYSIVTVKCKDRRRLLFDTACTLIDLQYVIFHASANSQDGYAFQEYFIRHKDGCALNTESEKERVIKCLKAAIQRRVCEGVRLELCATNRVGLLSDITRVLRENGLAVVRADVATQGKKSMNAFYVRDISGNNINMEFVKTMKTEIGATDLAVKNESRVTTSPTSPDSAGIRHRFSIGELVKSQFERFSHNFVATR